MRTFVLYAGKARTDGNFSVEDLPSSGGRMDLVARCITSALWLSHAVRPDARIYCVLNGPPKPPVTVVFDGSSVRKISPDERSIALWLKKALSGDICKDWKEFRPGILVARKSFQEIIKEHEGGPVYVLHENGRSIGEVNLKEDPVFVVGDNFGIPKNDESFALRSGEKLSIGKKSYLASSCIAVLNWFCDKNA
ncbi:MAG: tRNA (pseudouridine(54)-N(1))-methyltransferase TrmY [Candidatus Aenigmatarchaeota archaeon]